MVKPNGEKRLFVKLLLYALIVIIALIGTVWAITWNSAEKSLKEVTLKNNEQDQRIAKLEASLESIDKQLGLIYNEVRNKK